MPISEPRGLWDQKSARLCKNVCKSFERDDAPAVTPESENWHNISNHSIENADSADRKKDIARFS